jgi:hypothetical protein
LLQNKQDDAGGVQTWLMGEGTEVEAKARESIFCEIGQDVMMESKGR